MPETYTVDIGAQMKMAYEQATGTFVQEISHGKSIDKALEAYEQQVFTVYAQGMGVNAVPNQTYGSRAGAFLTPLRKAIAEAGGKLGANAEGLKVLSEALEPLEQRLIGSYVMCLPDPRDEELTAKEREFLARQTENNEKQTCAFVNGGRLEQKVAELRAQQQAA